MTKPLSVEQYTFYKTQTSPMSDTAIMKIHGMHNAALNQWKHENNLIGKKFEPAVKTSDVKLLKENDVARTKGWDEVAKTIENYTPNAKVKEKLQEMPKSADSSDVKPKQEQSPSEEKGTRITAPVDDKREVIRKMENRIDQLLTELEEVRMAVKGKEGVIDSLKRAITMREEIMEDQSDEIEGLKAEIGELKTQPNTLQLKNDILTNLMKLYLQEVEG